MKLYLMQGSCNLFIHSQNGLQNRSLLSKKSNWHKNNKTS
ncbi:hypothetical protein PTUN_a2410 [Pseudoalteromonas tunicata]|nr:hypothetical protein PTUN_a2410 [Pseudoalteromonas tunicata]